MYVCLAFSFSSRVRGRDWPWLWPIPVSAEAAAFAESAEPRFRCCLREDEGEYEPVIKAAAPLAVESGSTSEDGDRLRQCWATTQTIKRALSASNAAPSANTAAKPKRLQNFIEKLFIRRYYQNFEKCFPFSQFVPVYKFPFLISGNFARKISETFWKYSEKFPMEAFRIHQPNNS